MITIEGLCGIKATVLCDSISESGVRLTTFECDYPRIIHSEVMTHRMLSRNAASSRAIPAAKMLEQLTARPVRFGANVSGMQDSGEHDGLIEGESFEWEDGTPITPCYFADEAWSIAKEDAVKWSTAFAAAGYHKQVFNRLTEPFSMIKVVISATEWDNFFWLRHHEAADPTLQELARCMREAREQSTPDLLKSGEWHLPYLQWVRVEGGKQMFYLRHEDVCGPEFDSIEYISLEDAIKVSAARCAAVSYRNEDYNLEKCLQVHARLVGDERKHSSAMEHQATPMAETYQAMNLIGEKFVRNLGASVNICHTSGTWEQGISHMDRDGNLWSGNFKQWIQYRKLIAGENYTKRVS